MYRYYQVQYRVVYFKRLRSISRQVNKSLKKCLKQAEGAKGIHLSMSLMLTIRLNFKTSFKLTNFDKYGLPEQRPEPTRLMLPFNYLLYVSLLASH